MSFDKIHRYQPSGRATFDQTGWNAHYESYRKQPVLEFVRGIGWFLFIIALTAVCGLGCYLFVGILP